MRKRFRPRRSRKPEIITINISSTFIPRTRCSICGEGPSVYYYSDGAYLIKDFLVPRKLFETFKKYFKTMSTDWYMDSDPKYFQSEGFFGHVVDYKGYNPKLHRSTAGPHSNKTEYISCWGGCTIWAFTQKGARGRPEIENRKGKYSYPNKFVY